MAVQSVSKLCPLTTVVLFIIIFLSISAAQVLTPNPCTGLTYLNASTGQCLPLGTGYRIRFDRTFYNITYISVIPVPPSLMTPLFDIRVFIEPSELIDEMNTLILTGSEEIPLKAGVPGGVGAIHVLPQTDNVTIVNETVYSGTSPRFGHNDGLLAQTYNEINLWAIMQLTGHTASVNVQLTIRDICDTITCMNNGTCISSNGTCMCLPDYTGIFCQNNPCDSMPCMNNATCTNVSSIEYSCQCISGYTGSDCSVNINDCDGVDCGNGMCIDLLNDYYCQCIIGFTGSNCKTTYNCNGKFDEHSPQNGSANCSLDTTHTDTTVYTITTTGIITILSTTSSMTTIGIHVTSTATSTSTVTTTSTSSITSTSSSTTAISIPLSKTTDAASISITVPFSTTNTSMTGSGSDGYYTSSVSFIIIISLLSFLLMIAVTLIAILFIILLIVMRKRM